MIELFQRAATVGRTSLSVLILGETGVGKEIVAQSLHRASTRAARPMVHINCAAIPDTMLESELFGYEKGAFTGAVASKPGLFETADRGTVFLDEVGELPTAMQAKLLRVLETGEARRLGSLKSKVLDLRVVAATNRDLGAMIQDGRFRSDLYFRLNEATFRVPPLRERHADVAPLAELFVRRASGKRRPPPIAPGARRLLESYDWPGNVRELRSVIDRAVASYSAGEIREQDLVQPDGSRLRPSETVAPTKPGLQASVESHERDCVVAALERAGGHQGDAAKLLNISRRTLLNKLDALGIERPRKGARKPT